MSDKRNHKLNCITPDGTAVYQLTPDILRKLIEKKKSTLTKYPIYICFCNSCDKEKKSNFVLSSANSIGVCIPVRFVKEIDLGFDYFISFFKFFYNCC